MHPPGGPPGLAAVIVADPSPGPSEVVVETRAVSLNHRDVLHLRGGALASALAPDGIPCSDAAGIVVAAGAEVERVRVGDRVVSTFAPRWTAGPYSTSYVRTASTGAPGGVLAEYWLAPADAVLPMPAGMTFEAASTLPCAALTAWHALFEESAPIAGSTVLTLGTGGVAVFALQFAAWAGMRVVAATSRLDRVERLRALGAHDVVHGETPADVCDAVLRATQHAGVDHVIDVSGQGTLGVSLRMVRDGGIVSLIGALAPPVAVALSPVFLRNIRIQGIVVGSTAMFTRLLEAYATGLPAPVVDRIFPFDEAPRAFAHLEQRQHVGKVVIGVGDPTGGE